MNLQPKFRFSLFTLKLKLISSFLELFASWQKLSLNNRPKSVLLNLPYQKASFLNLVMK